MELHVPRVLEKVKVEESTMMDTCDKNGTSVGLILEERYDCFTSDSESDSINSVELSSGSDNNKLNHLIQHTGKPEYYQRYRILSISSLSGQSSSDDEDEMKNFNQEVSKNEKNMHNFNMTKMCDVEEIDLPPIDTLFISVKEEETKQIGYVKEILEKQVVIQAFRGIPPIDMESVLFLDNGKTALGRIFEVLGHIDEPCYLLRFNSSEDVQEKCIHSGTPVFYAPTTDHTKFIILDEMKYLRGSDASWIDDKEPPEHALDYSDDENEKLAKKKLKQQSTKVDSGNGIEESKERPRNVKYQKTNNGYRTSITRNTTNYLPRTRFTMPISRSHCHLKEEKQHFCPPTFGEPAIFKPPFQSVSYPRLQNSSEGWSNSHTANMNLFSSWTNKNVFPTTDAPMINTNIPPPVSNTRINSIPYVANYRPSGENTIHTSGQDPLRNVPQLPLPLDPKQVLLPNQENIRDVPTALMNITGNNHLPGRMVMDMEVPQPLINMQVQPPQMNVNAAPPSHINIFQPPRINTLVLPTRINTHGPPPPINTHGPPPQINTHGPPPQINTHGPPPQMNVNAPPPQMNVNAAPPPHINIFQPPRINTLVPPTRINTPGPPPPINTHGPPSINTHGIPPPINTHGLPPPINTHGPPSINTHGPPPPINTHGPPPPINTHGPPPPISMYGPPPELNSAGMPHPIMQTNSQAHTPSFQQSYPDYM